MNKSKKLSQQKHINTLFTEGVAFLHRGNFNEALLIFEKLLTYQPNNDEWLQITGSIALQIKSYGKAFEMFSKAIIVSPSDCNSSYNLGLVQMELMKFEEAIASYEKAIGLNSEFAQAYYNLGLCQMELKQFEASIASNEKVTGLMPDFVDAYFNIGVALYSLGQFESSIVSYDKAIAIVPEYAEAHNNRGVALKALGNIDSALASYDKAIAIKPEYAEAHNNRGVTLQELNRFKEALTSYNQAIAINQNYAICYCNIGNLLRQQKRLDEAEQIYKHAIDLDASIDFLLGNLVHTKMQLADWTEFETLVKQLTDSVAQQKICSPFGLLSLTDNPQLHFTSAMVLMQDKKRFSDILPLISVTPNNPKIRIGYFSPDFREHPVSYLTAELFEYHDREKFEVTAFSFGENTGDSYRKRLERSFDHFLDVKDQTDSQITRLAREMEIDIAVDLCGHTEGSRTNIFVMRAAPIQLSYIGYLGSMAGECYDYLIADKTLIPQDKQRFYSEKIVYLPCYQVNDSKREVYEKVFTRGECGVPENGFVFCCFNNGYKITPAIFDSWMRILCATDGSVLLLLDDNETAKRNLKKEAQIRGVDCNRIIFAKRLPLNEYLARYRIADMFLDTLPYNAGTTASDALRMGLPVLTQIGDSFASRMAASLLNAVGLTELITTNQQDYEKKAIELATDQDMLQQIKNKLRSNLTVSELFNAQLFAHHIELAYQKMYQLRKEGFAPDHIDVAQVKKHINQLKLVN